MKLARSKEWWLKLAEREGDATVGAGVPDVRGQHNGWQTDAEYRQSLVTLAALKERLFK